MTRLIRHAPSAIRALGAASLLVTVASTAQAQARQREADDTMPTGPLAALHFRALGPEGNRVASIIGEPGNPSVVYIGAANGGIWKTTDGGTNWRPIFDRENVSAVGALAMAPTAHDVIWAGTGEPWMIRPYYTMGDGVYKSTDAGRTWRHVGLDSTGHIARIIVDPHDANTVYVCAIGQAFRQQHDRGVFRTTDGGESWKQLLFVNDATGCSDLALDPNDSRTLYAGMWQVEIHRWNLNSGGPSSGVYVTRDGGDTWTKLAGHGLPAADYPLGKVAVGVAPNAPNRVYALVQDVRPGLYRSDDRGATWELVNQSHETAERSPYYTRLAISPDDENLLYFPSVSFSMSKDGGKTVFQPGRRGPVVADTVQRSDTARRARNPGAGLQSAGGDNHDVWIDPTNANRILVANDAGVSISDNRGATYQRFMLPISQVYHVFADNEIPYNVMGNIQDKSSFRGPSRNLAGGFRGGISLGDWTGAGGCEDAFAVPDPVDANVVWSGCDNGRIYRMDYRSATARDVSPWPVTSYGWAPADMKYRWDWITPIAISPHDHNRVYAGAQVVFMTSNGGQSWTQISPDLTLNDKQHEQSSGGITYDNLTTYDGATLYAIAESPVKAGVIWTGSDDGQINVTRDGGAHWSNVTRNIPDLPPWGTVWSIAPSHFDAGTAYAAVNLMHQADYDALVYETKDYGASWTLISATVPKTVNSSAHIIVEDPVRRGMLYLGTDNALYVTWNDGQQWTRLRNNLPPAPVYWMQVQPTFDDLVIGTHGRGVYILDDVTPLREWDVAQSQPFHLFPPRPAYRFRQRADGRETDPGVHVVGENPPYGADIDFELGAPMKDVVVAVMSGRDTIRTLKVNGQSGLNRVWWDLRSEPGLSIKMQTPPLDAPWAEPHRNYAAYGTRIPPAGPIVPPGAYVVHVKAGAHEASAPLTVLADPHSPGTLQSIRAQVAFARQAQAEANQAAKLINDIEAARRKVEDREQALGADAQKNAAAIQAAKDYDARLSAVEGKLIDVHNTGPSEDAFRNPVQLYERLSWMIGPMVGTPGSGSGGADLAPTAQQIAVNEELRRQLQSIQGEVKQLLERGATAVSETSR
ncbi:MAG TPA: hypothetical protein VJU87_00125 [Gemmatimonadaceae bacterium]|nr:hypothetical protein [Gemmatimonadaceae bacterium]